MTGRAAPYDRSPHVVLVGFMGAGKTTIGRLLAAEMRREFLDLDSAITARTGRTPSQIIDREGEDLFRRHETVALRDRLDAARPLVIATGGGAWTIERNRALIRERGCTVVWLDAAFDLCWRRAATGDDERPFARDRRRAETLFDRRRADYARADLRIIVTPERRAAEVTGEIIAGVTSQTAPDLHPAT